MKKSTIAILIVSFFALSSLIGCSNSNKTTKSETKESIKQETTKTEEPKKEVDAGITKDYIESKLSDRKVKIINISKSGDNYYTIDFKVREVASDSYYEKNILEEIEQISQVLSDASLVQGNEFFFEAKGPGKDKSGNVVDMNYATALAKGDDIAKCKFDDMKIDGIKDVLESFGLNQNLK